jgi:hypothetical protein
LTFPSFSSFWYSFPLFLHFIVSFSSSSSSFLLPSSSSSPCSPLLLVLSFMCYCPQCTGQISWIFPVPHNLLSDKFCLFVTTESMILLGSIQRLELIKLIERHIGRERRLQVAAKWKKEAQERSLLPLFPELSC